MHKSSSVANVYTASWLGIRASWTHTHAWVSAFPRHMSDATHSRALPLLDAQTRMGIHIPTPWQCTRVCGIRHVAWEHRHPCMCVRPGRTNPRCFAHIHDTVWCLHA